jgi:hypothetical protein
MQHLGDLPDTPRFSAVRVFRCYRCNCVTQEPGQRGQSFGHRVSAARDIILSNEPRVRLRRGR